MGYLIIALLSALAVVNCNDIHLGFATPRDMLIHNQRYDYNPSIYTRTESVLVNAGPNEHISRIEVIDMRELKDGTATISSGGIGARHVKIDLSGPAVFRGMTFDVRVYAAPDAGYAAEYRQPYPYAAKAAPYGFDAQQYNGGYAGIRQPYNTYQGNQAYPTKTSSYQYDTQQQYNGERYLKQ